MHEYIGLAWSHERWLGRRMRRPSESCVGSFSRPTLADSAAQTYSAKWFVIFFSDSAVGSFGEFPRAIDDPRPAGNCKSRHESTPGVDPSRQSQGWAAVDTAHVAHTAHADPRSNSCAACSRIYALSSRPTTSRGLGRTPGAERPAIQRPSAVSAVRCHNFSRSNDLHRRRKTRLCAVAAPSCAAFAP
jgi:hypothetical protein